MIDKEWWAQTPRDSGGRSSPEPDFSVIYRPAEIDWTTLRLTPPNTTDPYPKMDTSKLDPKPRGPAKPILKHDTQIGAPSSDNKRLVWDEDAIEEHDKLRGTRMKIDEPDTPYTHYDASADEDANPPRSPDESELQHDALSLASQWGDVASKLQAVADKRDATPGSPTRSPMKSCEEKRLEEEERARKFKEARKKHYNEAEMMRRWKAEHADDGDEEDDEMEE